MRPWTHKQRVSWEVFDHSAHSPDLAPSDYYLFLHLKRFLTGQHFPNDNELKTAVTRWLLCQAVGISSTPVYRSWSHGWTQDDIHCYRLFNIRHSWKKAAEICGRYGGELVLIGDYSQNNFTSKVALKSLRDSGEISYWIVILKKSRNADDKVALNSQVLIKTFEFPDFDTESSFDTVQIQVGGRTEEKSVSLVTLSGNPDLS
ncbi:hypothetical protein AVEN_3208-1 [Araneus ventricosus]|uniref:C-type lectin domain-containing protein n=1 Tax=Araneus ventricosus TaxID=182803 RepID=A0A4Y2M9Y5_ARAVE|nr:hypothetical protein AVEN_3208-1 [Araneus ventricosus]